MSNRPAGFMVQARRTRQEYDQAVENIKWLESENPVWGDGVPVSKSDSSPTCG